MPSGEMVTMFSGVVVGVDELPAAGALHNARTFRTRTLHYEDTKPTP